MYKSIWWRACIQFVLYLECILTFNHQGLTEQQATELLKQHGPNCHARKKRKTFLQKFFAQFADLMIVILLISAGLSLGMALFSGDATELAEPIIIVAIVLANALLGAVQEHRAEQSLDALTALTSPKTKVIRGGALCQIDSQNVVVGDVCIFESGDVVTADCVLLETNGLFVNQAPLTGESVPLEKTEKATRGGKNKVFSGCFVTKGSCVAKVYATGANTEIGKIATALSDTKEQLTPLQQKLKQLSKVIGIVCLAVCFVVLVLGFVKGVANRAPTETLTDVFLNVLLTSISLAVAAIPEGLPAVVTVVLAKGIVKMSKQNAVVKRLTAVEALGSCNVICTDKTGTLTQNKMTLVGVFDGSTYRLAQNVDGADNLLVAYSLCCDVLQNEDGSLVGDPTEIAVVSVTKIPQNTTRICEIPFDSATKLMSVVVEMDGKLYCITKGSLEKMSMDTNYKLFKQRQDLLAKKGLRVLALSVVELAPNFDKSTLQQTFNIVGLFALADPPRAEVKKAVALTKSAGIRTVMLTGDSVQTATEIARQLGIMRAGDLALDGEQLAKMTDEQLVSVVENVSVYARVTPTDKLKIVKAWQSLGKTVAMTGDGVNDAPALKSADIGCAMGSGTDVAKDSADIILADDNFATIVDAVSLGRTVKDNIKKSVLYLLTCNIGEVLSVFVALLLWNVSPFSAMQLLWINLVTDTLPALALGTYKSEVDVMRYPPTSRNATFFDGGGALSLVLGGIAFGIATLAGYGIGLAHGTNAPATMAFLILSLSQLFFALQVRSRRGLFNGGMTKTMAICMAISFALVFVVALVAPLQRLFDLATLPLWMYLVAILLALVPTILFEVARIVSTTKRNLKSQSKD